MSAPLGLLLLALWAGMFSLYRLVLVLASEHAPPVFAVVLAVVLLVALIYLYLIAAFALIAAQERFRRTRRRRKP